MLSAPEVLGPDPDPAAAAAALYAMLEELLGALCPWANLRCACTFVLQMEGAKEQCERYLIGGNKEI